MSKNGKALDSLVDLSLKKGYEYKIKISETSYLDYSMENSHGRNMNYLK